MEFTEIALQTCSCNGNLLHWLFDYMFDYFNFNIKCT